ncbi:hypothetical protein AB6H17_17415 [Proteus vulgaris]
MEYQYNTQGQLIRNTTPPLWR